jgi:hypothetical protein
VRSKDARARQLGIGLLQLCEIAPVFDGIRNRIGQVFNVRFVLREQVPVAKPDR